MNIKKVVTMAFPLAPTRPPLLPTVTQILVRNYKKKKKETK